MYRKTARKHRLRQGKTPISHASGLLSIQSQDKNSNSKAKRQEIGKARLKTARRTEVNRQQNQQRQGKTAIMPAKNLIKRQKARREVTTMKNTKNSAVATKEQEIFYPAHATKKATKTTKKSTKKSEVKTMKNTANATLQTLIDTLGSEAILTILQTVATNVAKQTPTKKATKSVPVTIREHISAPKKEKKVPKMFVSKNELAKQRKKWSSKKGVKLAVEGDWLWLSGNTKQYKDELKADGWRFTPKSKRGSWAIALNTANC